jgi:N utilization substance protein B
VSAHPTDPADIPAATPPRPGGGTRPRSAGRPRGGAGAGRRRARELALQGLYQHLVGGADAAAIDAHMREHDGFKGCDSAHFDALVHGVIEQRAPLDAVIARHTDRKPAQLSPVEHAALLIAGWELRHCVDIPYRVSINEAVELAKAFGGTDGHKFVNGVLDKVAAELRPEEFAAGRGG